MGHPTPPQNFKLKVLTCLTKLGDRDTYALASAELDAISRTLDSATLPTFLSCILSTDSTDKALVRKQCIHLLSSLSLLYPHHLSSYLPKILSHLTRRLRDPDSSIRTACVNTVSHLASKITRPPFSAFFKPLSDALFTEQDLNAQVGSALCLAAAIDGSPDPDPGRLGKVLLPKLERLLKNEGFKAKSAVMVVVGSVIGAGGAAGYAGVRSLVQNLVGFLSSNDWAARKAAAEALGRLAVVERDALAELKPGCMKIFVSRKFDKVKAVREVMNHMIEAWKHVPDVSDEVSPPPRSQASSKEDASDGRYPPRFKVSSSPGLEATHIRKKFIPPSRSTPPDVSSATTTTRRRSSLKSNDKIMSPAFRKADHKKPSDWRFEIAVPCAASSTGVLNDDLKGNENVSEQINEKSRFSKPEAKRAIFNKNYDDKMQKFGILRSGSRVVPCHDESPDLTVVVSNDTENHHKNHKDCEDLSLIRNQLVQIEKQQSSLLDLLQRFMGSSQNGMHSLETRVHGLELALDEISYDLAVSTGRMTHSHRTTCCLLPGADFLSSKFWRKSEGRYSSSRLSMSTGPPSSVSMRHRARNGNALENRGLRLQGGSGFIVNPLAEVRSETRANSEVSLH